MSNNYYMPRPIEPSRDWVGRLMSASLWISVAGFIVYGLFAYAFEDIAIIPPTVQSALVLVGSALIVTGAEVNTPPTIVAVARKYGRRKHQRLDLIIGCVSLAGAIAGALLMFALRQPNVQGIAWRQVVRNWGPLVIGVTVVIDYFGCASELGLLRSDYDIEMREWLEAEQEWNEAHGIEPEVDRSDWRTANIGDFRVLIGSMNGNRRALDKRELQAHFDEMHLVAPTKSTVDRWWREEMN